MSEELTQLIIKEKVKHHNRNEIIRAVCERGGLSWAQGEKLVKQVEDEHGQSIARKQGPFMIFLSIATLVMGIVLVLYSLEFFIAFFQGDTLEKILSVRTGYYRIGSAVTGFGMILGGHIGLWNSLAPYFE